MKNKKFCFIQFHDFSAKIKFSVSFNFTNFVQKSEFLFHSISRFFLANNQISCFTQFDDYFAKKSWNPTSPSNQIKIICFGWVGLGFWVGLGLENVAHYARKVVKWYFFECFSNTVVFLLFCRRLYLTLYSCFLYACLEVFLGQKTTCWDDPVRRWMAFSRRGEQQ